MGWFHCQNLAFVWHSLAAVRALGQILLPSRALASVVDWQAMGVYRQPERHLLCFQTSSLYPTPAVINAIRAVDVSALAAALAQESARDIAEEAKARGKFTGDESEDDAWEVSAVDRCLAWLAEQVGGPVSYWDHLGNHGLVVEEFTGYGATPAAWRNREESQGPGWSRTRPYGALTAALWHVGFQSRNLSEEVSSNGSTIALLYGAPINILAVKPSTPAAPAAARASVRLPKFLTREGDPDEVTR